MIMAQFYTPSFQGGSERYARFLFREAVDDCLTREGVNYLPVTDYTSDVLGRSMTGDGFFVYDTKTSRTLDTPHDLISYADGLRDNGDTDDEFEVRLRTGDHMLLMLGMFPMSPQVVSLGPSIYSDCGRFSYLRAEYISRKAGDRDKKTFTFEAMADFFPRIVSAVRKMMGGGLTRKDEEIQSALTTLWTDKPV